MINSFLVGSRPACDLWEVEAHWALGVSRKVKMRHLEFTPPPVDHHSGNAEHFLHVFNRQLNLFQSFLLSHSLSPNALTVPCQNSSITHP